MQIKLNTMRTDAVIKKFIRGLKKYGLESNIDKMYLFGSRAKGTERPDSDYDLLLVVKFDKTSDVIKFKDRVYDIVMDILLNMRHLVSLKIFKKSEFERLRRMGTPFTQNILKEGIRIG